MGRISSAAKGAAEGSVVEPGIGTAIGAVGGFIRGGAKKATNAPGDGSGHGGMKLLAAEFLICIVLLGLSPLGSGSGQAGASGASADATTGAANGALTPGAFMLKGSTTFGVFLVLGLIGAIGPGAAKFAAGIGGLMTLAIVFNEANSFSGLVDALTTAKAPKITKATPPDPQTGNKYNPPDFKVSNGAVQGGATGADAGQQLGATTPASNAPATQQPDPGPQPWNLSGSQG